MKAGLLLFKLKKKPRSKHDYYGAFFLSTSSIEVRLG